MNLMTYQDALTRLQRFIGGTGFARSDDDLKLAVTLAYEGITQARRWAYYNWMWGFTTQAAIESTGTYVNSTRKLTLATAAPSWGLVGAVLMDGKVGDVEAINTSSNPATLVMGADLNFGENYSSSTSLTLYQEHIVLPDNYREIQAVVCDPSGQPLRRITPSQYMSQFGLGLATGEPLYYAIMQDPENLGRTALYLYPAPTTARTYRIHTIRKPRDLRWTGSEDAAFGASNGTVTITNGTTTVTGSNTAIEESMEGSVMRLTQSTTQLPTDRLGSNPYTEQKIVSVYTSATSWTIDSAVSQGYSGTKFIISDPIDIDPIMQPAFLARCRLEIARLRTDTHLVNQLMFLEDQYQKLFDEAAATDAKNFEPRRTGGRRMGIDWTHLPYSGDSM